MSTHVSNVEPLHDRGFRWVEVGTRRFEFSPPQAKCLGVLWHFWRLGTPIVLERDVLQVAEVQARSLKEVFARPPGNAAWGLLISDGDRRGTIRLNMPASPPHEETRE
jgi:hypothetical protein